MKLSKLKKSKNIYIRSVTRRCKCLRVNKNQCYSIGEYISGKWHNVQDVCENCFLSLVEIIKAFEKQTSKEVFIVAYKGTLPDFITQALRTNLCNKHSH